MDCNELIAELPDKDFYHLPSTLKELQGTDIAKITRKLSKPDKHGHGNRKSTKELEVSSKRSIKSTLGQHWSITRRQNL
ncbi:hypothetical protein Tco_0603010 [Tanacetum coccineum]